MLREDLAENLKSLGDAAILLDAIMRATDGSTDLIDRAKKLAKAVSTQEAQVRPTDVGDSLGRAISLVTKAFGDRSISVSQSIPAGVKVLADELLDEVFTNILSNAVKYTNGEEVPIWVRVEEEVEAADEDESPRPQPGPAPSRRLWRIDIEDKGKGIPDQMKVKVFTRYGTAASGSGLGLSIVHALVTGRYKGRVRAVNRVEGDFSAGTRVQIWMPGAP